MKADKLITVIDEAERFLERAKMLRTFQMGGTPTRAVVASVRRASLDLSRALIELRKG